MSTRLVTSTGVTVEVADDKAKRLLSSSNYEKAESKKAPAKRSSSTDDK